MLNALTAPVRFPSKPTPRHFGPRLLVAVLRSRALGDVPLLPRPADQMRGEPALADGGVDLQFDGRIVLVHPGIRPLRGGQALLGHMRLDHSRPGDPAQHRVGTSTTTQANRLSTICDRVSDRTNIATKMARIAAAVTIVSTG